MTLDDSMSYIVWTCMDCSLIICFGLIHCFLCLMFVSGFVCLLLADLIAAVFRCSLSNFL